MKKTLIFDIETDSLNPTVVWCICAVDVETGEQFKYGPESLSEALQGLFPKYQVLVGHNITTFDLEALRRLQGYTPEPHQEILDTLVLCKLMYPDIPKGNSLEAWGHRLFKPKQEFKEFSNYSEEMLEYCMNDVLVTLSIYNYIYNIYSKEYTNKECYYIEERMHCIIHNQESNGVYFNVNKAKEYITTLQEEILTHDNKLAEYYIPRVLQGSTVSKPFTVYGAVAKPVSSYLEKCNIDSSCVCGPFTKVDYEDFNPNSVIQIKKILLRNGWAPDEYTDTGQPALSDTSLRNLGALGGLVTRRQELGHALGKLAGLVDRVRPDSRIGAGANSCATNTGRMRHIVVANIPRVTYNKLEKRLVWYPEPQGSFFGTEMRSLFCAPPDRVLAGYDAKGLELRDLAHYINNENYTRIVADGDPHEFTQRETGIPSRDDAKTLIYALVYGARDNKIGSIVGGGSREGAAIRKRLFKAIPGFENLLKRVETAAQKGYLIGLDGRKLFLREGKSPLNTLIQGAGAVCMKYISIRLDDLAKERSLDGFKIIDMHDEGQWEINPDHKDLFKELVTQAFVECTAHFKLNCPLAADVKFGNTWAETH